MDNDITEIGLDELSDAELEEIASSLQSHLLEYLEDSPEWSLFTGFHIVISLTYDEILTFTLDIETPNTLTAEQTSKVHSELQTLAEQYLKDELLCHQKTFSQ